MVHPAANRGILSSYAPTAERVTFSFSREIIYKGGLSRVDSEKNGIRLRDRRKRCQEETNKGIVEHGKEARRRYRQRKVTMEQKGEKSLSQISTFPLKESPEATWKVCFKIIDWFWPLRFLLQWFYRGCSWLRCLFIVKPREGKKRQPAAKRLGTVAQILFAIIPVRFQLALGFLHSMCQTIEVEETLNSPVTPSMRGSKRKMEEKDAALDEPQCWIKTILKDLPDDDDSQDPSYEPSKSESDSEEYKSQNDTEGDLEYEEKNGLVMLKEDPILPQGQNGEGTAAETPQTADAKEELVASETPGEDDKLPEYCLLASSGTCSQKNLESTEITATSIQGCGTVDNNDSEDVWTEASCPE